jgi:hypothetical protein
MTKYRFRKGNGDSVGNNGPRITPIRRVIAQELIAHLNELDPTTRETRMRGVVRQLVKRALTGDPDAIREVLDRCEGEVMQVAKLADARRNDKITRDTSPEEAMRIYTRMLGDLDGIESDDVRRALWN